MSLLVLTKQQWYVYSNVFLPLHGWIVGKMLFFSWVCYLRFCSYIIDVTIYNNI